MVTRSPSKGLEAWAELTATQVSTEAGTSQLPDLLKVATSATL